MRALLIEGNPLTADFLPSTPLPNLLYLELVACSLSRLLSNMATRLSNLRVINCNYNFLTTLDCLGSMTSLRKITAVGCRLEEGSYAALSSLSELEEIDLRYALYTYRELTT
jgi:Leucine-rich repeat (LRR) protein